MYKPNKAVVRDYQRKGTPAIPLIIAFSVSLILPLASLSAEGESRIPGLEDFMALEVIRFAEISPDGDRIAYSTFNNDFENDVDMTRLWLVSTRNPNPIPLTYGDQPVDEFEWSSNGEWLAFMRDGELFLIRAAGGEARHVELEVNGIRQLRFSPDDSSLYFTAGPKDKSKIEAREEKYGSYTVFREDGGYRHVWRLSFDEDMEPAEEAEQLTEGREWSVVDFALSPNGEHLVFATWPTPHLVDLLHGKVFSMSADGGDVTLMDETPGAKGNLLWNADNNRFAYTDATSFPGYSDIVIHSIEGSDRKVIEMTRYDPQLLHFDKDALFFGAGDRTGMHLYRMKLSDESVRRVSTGDASARRFSFTRNGDDFSYLSVEDGRLSELFVSNGRRSEQLTDFSKQIEAFELPAKELIRWKSYDGLEIEAVLTKPVNFEEGKKYPLFVRTHGGPTGTDRPYIAGAPLWIYLPDVLAGEGEGALVLQTNYRGSANYGEEFQQSNLRNLGIGPARDIIAGIEMLIGQGLVDPERIGCLGWSQGGHISAMLATYSDICTAAIMGAGISDWRTYYYNTDITQFTTEYFNATPLADDEVYAKTSPVTYIDNASTPVLIQHGENDQRVPIANGYQLRQLLLDKGVDSRMVVYSDMGHGPSSPKTRRAVNQHALDWFREYLFDGEQAEFVYPVEPEEPEDCDCEDPEAAGPEQDQP